MGILATLVILVVIPLYGYLEPQQQENLLEGFRSSAVRSSTDLYADNCVVCHGAAGEGIAGNPPLNSEALRMMAENDLYKVISRGREGTLMAAWAIEEGGVFTNPQVKDLVTFIQSVQWESVEARVTEMGLTPPQVVELEVPEEMLARLAEREGGETLSSGLLVYAKNCAACHGANGAGSEIAPALDSPELRKVPSEDLAQIIGSGVPGTLMAGWGKTLSPGQLEAVMDLIYRWPELLQAGIEFPEAEVQQIHSTPEMIEDGRSLFNIACKSCHGLEAYGTRIGPALNNQLFLSETPDAAIYQIIAGGMEGSLMPAWGNRLTDTELQSLVAYLRNLEPSAPAIVPPITDVSR
jgi:mono/diheme cytochrome c family protein